MIWEVLKHQHFLVHLTRTLSPPLIRAPYQDTPNADQIFNVADLHFSGQFTCSNHAGNNLSLIKGGLGVAALRRANSNPSAISGKMGDCGKELIGNCFWLFIRGKTRSGERASRREWKSVIRSLGWVFTVGDMCLRREWVFFSKVHIVWKVNELNWFQAAAGS